jgi:hypothetical protein
MTMHGQLQKRKTCTACFLCSWQCSIFSFFMLKVGLVDWSAESSVYLVATSYRKRRRRTPTSIPIYSLCSRNSFKIKICVKESSVIWVNRAAAPLPMVKVHMRTLKKRKSFLQKLSNFLVLSWARICKPFKDPIIYSQPGGPVWHP